jgi:transposase InsO family protein
VAAHVYLGDGRQPVQPVTIVWEEVAKLAQRLGVVRPSYETVRAFLENPAELSRSMKTLQQKGKRGYEAQFAPYLKRGYTEPANQIWVSDHALIDVLTQDDCFTGSMQHIRIRMTTIMDYRSRFVVGVSWCEEGSQHSIKRALLQAILRYGPPEVFYCDNGKDFRSVARGAQKHELELYAAMEAEGEARTNEVRILEGSVLRRLGIAVVFCLPFHPQSKHIERYHRTYHERVDIAFPTYTAGKPHLRLDATDEGLKRHKKLLQMGDTSSSSLPLASEYIAMGEAWIEKYYHARPHSGEGMNGRSPAECFAQERNPNQKPTPSLEELAPLFAEVARRKVMNCAIELTVRGESVRFVPSADDARAPYVMHERAGQQIQVAYDPLNLSRAVALDLEGFSLCRLERQGLTRFSQDAGTQKEIAAISQQRGMLAKATRQSVAALAQRVRGSGYVPQADQLRQLAGLQATGTDAVSSTASTTNTSSIVQRPRKTARAEAPRYVADVVHDFFGA